MIEKAQRQNLEGQIERADAKVRAVKMEARQAVSQLKDARDHSSEVEAEMKKLQNILESERNDKRSISDSNRRLETQVADLKSHVDSDRSLYKTELAKLSAELEHVKEVNAQYTKHLEQERIKREETTASYKQLQQHAGILKQRIKELEAIQADYDEKLSRASGRSGEELAILVRVQKDLEETRTKVDSLESKLRDSEKQRRIQEKLRAQAERQLKTMETDLVSSRQELDRSLGASTMSTMSTHKRVSFADEDVKREPEQTPNNGEMNSNEL